MANQVASQGILDLGIISKIIQYSGQIKAIIDAATSNEEIGDKIKAIAAPLVGILEGIGANLFPNLAPALHLVAGAIATFDPNGVKWLQAALNQYLDLEPPLDVDGEMGPKTIAAVKEAQAKLGLDPDGFAGKVTYAALAAALRLQAK